MRRATALALAALLCSGAFGWFAFNRDIGAAKRRTEGRSDMLSTSFGQLEYAASGTGPPLLMIHGTGGGFDQGLTFTEGLVRRGYRVIAPSRFGYLRSDFPDDPSSERQADAFAEMLDKLGIDRLAVAGGSAGALSAVQFALRHPDRCSALILIVPAANVRGTDPVEMTGLQEFLVREMTTSDLLFWAGVKLRRDQMIATLLATDPALVPRPRYNGPALMVVVPGYVLSEPSHSEPAPVAFVRAPLPPMGLRTVSAAPPTLKVTVPFSVTGPFIALSPLLLSTIAPPLRM